MDYVNIGATVLVLLLIAATAAAEVYRETHYFRVTRYNVASNKLTGITRDVKILFLSDLHNWTYGNKNERLLQSIKDEKPDLILIGGDMLVGKEGVSYETAQFFTERLSDVCPTVYANGNHEQRMKEDTKTYGNTYETYKNYLEKRGIHFLENASVRVELGEIELHICGLELPSSSYKKFRKDEITAMSIADCFGFLPSEDVYTILLAHNPTYMEAYLEWGADMILSGHLHGGLIRVPGIGGIVTPQGFFFPRYSGEMTQKGSRTVIVSRGLGTHTLNIRLFNMPELISISLGANKLKAENKAVKKRL